MNPEQVQKALVEKVAVTNQMVTYAKAYFIEHYNSETRALINSLLDFGKMGFGSEREMEDIHVRFLGKSFHLYLIGP